MADHHDASSHHTDSSVDLKEREQMFDSFIKFWIYTAAGTIATLILVALFFD